jgi:hypothetical protein
MALVKQQVLKDSDVWDEVIERAVDTVQNEPACSTG